MRLCGEDCYRAKRRCCQTCCPRSGLRANSKMSITRHHNEWLSLVPNSGPFLSLPVLAQAFPQGLDAHDADHARRLRMAFDEWDDNQLGHRPDPGIHREWIK